MSDVVVEVKDPSDGSTNIQMQDLDNNNGPSSSSSGILGRAGERLSRLNPWREVTPEERERQREEKLKAAEEKKRKADEAALQAIQDDITGGAEEDNEVGCCRRCIAKCLPPPWNYIVAGSPGTAGAAYGGYWLWTNYMTGGDDTAMKTE